MPNSAVLYIGDSFAKIAIVTPTGCGPQRRWYLGREPLSKAVSQFLLEHRDQTLTDLVVASEVLENTLRLRHGMPPAFLVTSGFEGWLALNRPIKQQHFTILAERAPSVVDPNLVFGVSERMGPDGNPEKPIEIADLEFLAAKLKLNNIQEVAVGLVHAGRNPAHEQLVGQFFRDQGFCVHLSHQSSEHPFEVARWWAALVNGYLRPRQKELATEIKSALELSGQATAKLMWLGGQGVFEHSDSERPLETMFGAMLALQRWRQTRGAQALIYLGLEDFVVFDGRWPDREEWLAEFGPVAVRTPGFVRGEPQATQLIEKSFWGGANFSKEEGGFEPGPMAFGRGVKPQLLDVLWVRDRLVDIAGVSDRLQDRMRTRVEESLTAIAREDASDRGGNAQSVAEYLEIEAARLLAANLEIDTREVVVTGPLASAFKPTLEPILTAMAIRGDFTPQSILLEAMARWTMAAAGEGGAH